MLRPTDDSSGNAAIDPVSARPTSDTLGGSGTEPASKSEEKYQRRIEAAKNRQAWLKSKESAQASRSTRILLATIPLWGAVGALIGHFYATTEGYLTVGPITVVGLGTGLFIGAYITLFLIVAARGRARRNFEDRRLIGEAQEELKQAELEITSNVAVDFITLWSTTPKTT